MFFVLKFQTPPPSPIKRLCAICQRRCYAPEGHVVDSHLISVLEKETSYAGLEFHIGELVCCNHFLRHESCDTAENLVASAYVGHMQNVLQLPKRTRNDKRRRSTFVDLEDEDEELEYGPASKKHKKAGENWFSPILSLVTSLVRKFVPNKSNEFVDPSLAFPSYSLIPPEEIIVGNVMLEQRPDPIPLEMPHAREEDRLLEDSRERIRQLLAHQAELILDAQRLRDLLNDWKNRCEEMTGFDCFWRDKLRLMHAAQQPGSTVEDQKVYDDFLRSWTGIPGVDRIIEVFAEKVPKQKTGRPSKFSPQQWSALFLIYLRMGCTVAWMSNFCGAGETTISDHFNHLRDNLREWAESYFTLPSIAKWTQATPDDFKAEYPNALSFFIDGTVVPIYKPKNNSAQKKAYNGKHGFHALVFSILVTPDGRIVWLSQIDLGNQHDATAWNSSNGPASLARKYRNIATAPIKDADHPQLTIGGDKAYPRIKLPGGWKVVVTKTAKDNAGQGIRFFQNGIPHDPTSNQDPGSYHVADDTQSVISGTIAKWRSTVERTFAVVKQFKILSAKFATTKKDRKRSANLIRIVCALANVAMGFTVGDNE